MQICVQIEVEKAREEMQGPAGKGRAVLDSGCWFLVKDGTAILKIPL